MQWSYEKLVEILRNEGHRLTKSRLDILQVLLEKQHLTLNGIIKELRKKGAKNVNVATVYNTLDLLVKEEIVYLNVFNGRDIVFELSQPVLVHLVCESCRKVIHINNSLELSDDDLKVVLGKLQEKLIKANFEPVHYKIEAHGICNNCKISFK